MPAIVQMHDPDEPEKAPHFLVLLRAEADSVLLLDPPTPPYFLVNEGFENQWSGKVLVFPNNADEVRQLERQANQAMLLRSISWIWLAAGILALTCALMWLRHGAGGSLRARALLNLLPGILRTYLPKRPLARITALVLLLLGLASVATILLSPGPVPHARLVLDSSVINLGEVPNGTRSIEFAVRNEGQQPLTITEIQSNCSCVVAAPPARIEAGGTAVLHARLKVTPGARLVRMILHSNDPAGPKEVFVNWRGKGIVQLLPPIVAGASASIEEPFEHTLHLVFPGGRTALIPRLERFECPSNRVRVQEGNYRRSAGKLVNSGGLEIVGEGELHLFISPPRTPELFQEQCKLYYRYGEEKVELVARMEVRFLAGELTPEVPAITFAAPTSGGLIGQERILRVSDAGR
jgi:hypothetical protein